MKFSTKYISLAVLAALSFIPGMAEAACNDANGNAVDFEISGPSVLGVGQEITNSMVPTPLGADLSGGTYLWSFSEEFTAKNNDITHSNIILIASTNHSSSVGAETISCIYTREGSCEAEMQATILSAEIAGPHALPPNTYNLYSFQILPAADDATYVWDTSALTNFVCDGVDFMTNCWILAPDDGYQPETLKCIVTIPSLEFMYTNSWEMAVAKFQDYDANMYENEDGDTVVYVELEFDRNIPAGANGEIVLYDDGEEIKRGLFFGAPGSRYAVGEVVIEGLQEPLELRISIGSNIKPLGIVNYGSSPYTHRWQDNALSQGRKISLSGMPMPDVAQHQEGESDYKQEETYVDAFSLDLRHDVTDIFVPVGSDHFALEVRRSLSQESWTINSYPLDERPDMPFGPGWSSGICPNVHKENLPGNLSRIIVTDYNGQTYRFMQLYWSHGGDNGEPLVRRWIEPTSTQSALSMEGVELSGGTGTSNPWKLTLPNGTECIYQRDYSCHEEINPVFGTGGETVNHYFYRIDHVQDRTGQTLKYGFSGRETDEILPSSITAEKTGLQNPLAILIGSDDGIHVSSVTDPMGNVTEYAYNTNDGAGGTLPFACLVSVDRELNSSTDYGYTFIVEEDTRNGAPLEHYYHLMIDDITDANDNSYGFQYARVQRYNYSTSPLADQGQLEQYGNLYRLSQIDRPSGPSVTFGDSGAIGTWRENGVYILEGTPTNTVTDVNAKTWTYTFSDPHATDPVVDNSEIRLYEYRQLQITAPDNRTETYRFDVIDENNPTKNGLYPMAIVAQTNYSDQVTSYDYDYTLSDCTNKPSAQYDALGNDVQYTYTRSYGNQVKSQTDAMDRTTVFGFDELGNRTSVTNFSAGVGTTILGLTDMTYGDSNFSNFMTLKTVRKLNNSYYSGEPTWVTDMKVQYVAHAQGKVYQEIVDPGGVGHLNLTTTYDYDANNNLISVLDPRGNETVNTYDELNRLITISFYEGTAASGTLQCTKEFWYDRRSNKRWEKDENDHYTYYEYDEFNNLVRTVRIMNESFSGPASGTSTYTSAVDDIVVMSDFNYDGTLAYTISPEGMMTEYWYDDLRRLTDTYVDVDYDDRPSFGHPEFEYWTHYDYTGVNCGAITLPPYKFTPTTVTDPEGYSVQTIYDVLNRPVETLAQIESPTSDFVSLATMGYDKLGNLKYSTNWVNDSEYQATETIYDGLNRPIKVINPDDTEVGVRYTSTGLEWQSTNELDRVSTVEYDAAGRPVKTIAPELSADNTQAETETGYDDNSNVVWVKDAEDNITTNVYDYRNRLVQTIAPAVTNWSIMGSPLVNPTVTTIYDAVGNVVAVTDAEENTTTNFYDAANRMFATWAPAVAVYGVTGNVRPTTTNTFDKAGNITVTRDANGNEVNMYYDAIGRLTDTVDAENNVISFDYDANGNQTFLTDGNTNTTEFVYDGLRRKFQTIYPDTNYEETVYDRVGNAIRRIDCNGVETQYDYDDRNRLDLVTYPGNRTREYMYDDAGNLTNVVESADLNACVSYTYDELNRVTSETSVGVTHEYKYDLNGNRTNAIYGATNRETDWTYDALGRVTKISEDGNDTDYYYDLNGQLCWRQYPSAIWEERTYDAMGRLSKIETLDATYSETFFQTTYRYDAVGSAREQYNISYISGETNYQAYVYTYDDRYRLEDATFFDYDFDRPGWNISHTYYGWDSADNPTYKYTVNPSDTEYLVYTNNALNQVTGWSKAETYWSEADEHASCQYDANGNRTNKRVTVAGASTESTDYFYDEDNRLLQVTTDSLVNQFQYDYRSRRYYRSTSSGSVFSVFDGGLSVQEYTNPFLVIEDSDITSFGYGQDVNGVVESVSGGSGIHLTGNVWKKVPMQITLTSSSVLHFDVKIDPEGAGEIIAIGLDNDSSYNISRLFQLAGSQHWAREDYHADNTGEWVSMSIPIGQYYTGNMNYLTFVCDDDSIPSGQIGCDVIFQNIWIENSSTAREDLLSDNLDAEYVRGPDLGGGIGGMVYSIRDDERIFSHSNHRGDVIARTDDTGSLTWYAVYEAYGTRPYEWTDGTTGNPDRQMANTKEEEAEIGLLNEGMRYRDLETGTFLTRDPIGYGDGPNMYCYVHCNPITHFDAFGLKDSEGKGGFFSSIVSGVKNVGGAVVSGTKAVGGALCSSAKKIGEEAVDGAKEVGGVIATGAKALGEAAVTAGEYAWEGVKGVGKGAAWAVPRVWASPNTAVGLAWGGVGFMAGVLPGVDMPSVTLDHNAIQFENHPLMFGGDITFGNTIHYMKGFGPGASAPTYESSAAFKAYREGNGPYPSQIDYVPDVADHEEAHTYQYQVLGPLYLPVYLMSGGISASNPLEKSADEYGMTGKGWWPK